MTGQQLAVVAGIVLSLLFSYVPGLQAWYSAKDSQTKSLIMLGAVLLVAAGALGVSCAGWWPIVTCDKLGTKSLIEAFVAAMIANQATYLVSPQPAKPTPPAA